MKEIKQAKRGWAVTSEGRVIAYTNTLQPAMERAQAMAHRNGNGSVYNRRTGLCRIAYTYDQAMGLSYIEY